MVVIGIDAHKRTHTAVAVDAAGAQLAVMTVKADGAGHLELLRWAERFGPERRFGAEDCRHLTTRLERDLLVAGESLVRVPPKMMAGTRRSARTRGKSDPIDALAVARAALREPNLPVARLDGVELDIRLIVDHREDLVRQRTADISRLRWHLHDLDPALDDIGDLTSFKALGRAEAALAGFEGTRARLARELLVRCRELTVSMRALEREVAGLVTSLAPALLALEGCGALTAAKIVGETADVTRFRDRNAFARHNGTAPIPVWSGNSDHHRLNRGGNRQLNAALHRIAVTQLRGHGPAPEMVARLTASGKTKRDAMRVLRRRLSDVVYRCLLEDHRAQLAASGVGLAA
jgi:transposase